MTARERKSDFKLTTYTPYLALTDELWGVCYDNFEENWLHYNGTALYLERLIVYFLDVHIDGTVLWVPFCKNLSVWL